MMPNAVPLCARFPWLATCLLALAGLAGCATGPRAGAEAAAADSPGPSVAVDPDTVLLEAETALQRKRHRQAAELYAAAADLSADETLFATAAKVAFEYRQMGLVSRIATRWLAVNPTSEAGARFAAFAALDRYRITEAVTHFDQLLQSAYINEAAGFLGLAPQIAANGTPAGALAVLKALVAKHPDVAEGHHVLAEAALRAEDLGLALRSAERAHGLSPYWTPAALLLARVQVVSGRDDEGLAKAREVLEREGTPDARLELALLLFAADRDEEGMQELAALEGMSAESAVIVERLRAIRDFEGGRYDSARQRFERLVQLGVFVYESQFFLGGLAEQRQAWEEARRSYSRVTSGDYAVTAQTRLANILDAHASPDAALAWLADFAEQKPEHAISMIVARSRLLEQRGDTRAALALFDEGLTEYPDAHDLLLSRSYLKERLDDVRGSIADLERLQTLRENDPVVQNALGYLLVDRTRRHEEGLALVEQALAQTPDSGAVLDSMGWALHRVGRDAEALSYLERARERIYDPEVELHVGDVLWALGRRDEARQTWERAAARHPDMPEFGERLRRNRR